MVHPAHKRDRKRSSSNFSSCITSSFIEVVKPCLTVSFHVSNQIHSDVCTGRICLQRSCGPAGHLLTAISLQRTSEVRSLVVLDEEHSIESHAAGRTLDSLKFDKSDPHMLAQGGNHRGSESLLPKSLGILVGCEGRA